MKSLLARVALCAAAAFGASAFSTHTALADEVCNPPDMRRLIAGQEHFVDVWTLGIMGLGDGSAPRKFGRPHIDAKPGPTRLCPEALKP